MLTLDEIRQIKSEASKPGANVSDIARRHRVSRRAVHMIREGQGALGRRLPREQLKEAELKATQGAQGVAWLVEVDAAQRESRVPNPDHLGDWKATYQAYLDTGVFVHPNGETFTVDEALAGYQSHLDSASDF